MEEKSNTPVLNPSTKMTVEGLQKKLNEASTIINQQQSQFNQLKEAYLNLMKVNEQMNSQNIAIRLESCFKVMVNETFFPAEFVQSCAKEVMEILTPPVEEKEEDGEEVAE